jgi:hypothetical protein
MIIDGHAHAARDYSTASSMLRLANQHQIDKLQRLNLSDAVLEQMSWIDGKGASLWVASLAGGGKPRSGDGHQLPTAETCWPRAPLAAHGP